MALNVLVVTKGHAYDYNGFHAIFDESPELSATFVEQPAAQVVLRPENVAPYDAVLFYDMCGIPRDRGSRGEAQPPADYAASIEALLEKGVGLMLINHALVQWPEWPLWREISGTTFRLTAGEVDGRQVPGSGYCGGRTKHPDGRHRLTPATPGHPVSKGLEGGFELVDEIYLRTPLPRSPDVVPLFRSDYPFTDDHFNPPPLAPAEEQAAWRHPPGDDVVVWAKRTRNSPVVACEPGDGPPAYSAPGFRRLLINALSWVASDEAKAWAAAR